MNVTARLFRIVLIAGLLPAGLVGCASFDAKTISASGNAVALEERTLDDPALREFVGNNLVKESDSDAAWHWNLESLTLAAFYFQPDLDVARAQWAVAEAARLTAGERPASAIDVSAGRNTTTAEPSPSLATAGLNLTLETGGKRGYRIARAAYASEAARLNIRSVAWQVRSQVRSAFLALCAAVESEKLLQQQQQTHAEYLNILEGQFRAGSISGFDVNQARLAATAARLALHDAVRRETEARAQLAAAIGVPASALDAVDFPVAALDELPSMPDEADARRQALLHRADILGSLAGYAASQSALQLEIARQYPDITLGPGYEYDQADNKWSLGVSLAMPAARNRGPIAEARARRDEAAASFNALQAGVLQQIDLAVANYGNALQAHAEASAMLTDISAQRDITQAMFTAGAVSRSDLTALQLQLSAITLSRLDALLQAQQAAGQLETAIQSSLGLPEAFWDQSPQLPTSNTGEAGS